MSDEVEPPRVADLLTGFLHTFGGRPVDVAEIERTIRGIAAARGEDWPWVAKWVAEEGPGWVNNATTLFIEVPLENLAGRNALEFSQQVWMLRPSLFEYQTWGGRGFVRICWNPEYGYPCVGEADETEQDCRVLGLPQYVSWSARKRREGAPVSLMDSLDDLSIRLRPRDAAALTEEDFERWLEGARRHQEAGRSPGSASAG
ncbi:MAG: hypothetical protein U0790_28510 [Isosphaeraceae bacterium]